MYSENRSKMAGITGDFLFINYFLRRNKERFWAVVEQPYFYNSAAISALAIQQTEFILVQDRLYRSFRKSCPAKGDRRKLLIINEHTFLFYDVLITLLIS